MCVGTVEKKNLVDGKCQKGMERKWGKKGQGVIVGVRVKTLKKEERRK